jgi:hypothetical protein
VGKGGDFRRLRRVWMFIFSVYIMSRPWYIIELPKTQPPRTPAWPKITPIYYISNEQTNSIKRDDIGLDWLLKSDLWAWLVVWLQSKQVNKLANGVCLSASLGVYRELLEPSSINRVLILNYQFNSWLCEHWSRLSRFVDLNGLTGNLIRLAG